ncbi:hypothetical protein DL93DRAFT_2090366 [Clavulina sp. PMI_390]|nr:hypothetical protein DL93DRAFT_2090366 [Clavulina sp. PMI_390]
MVSHSLHLSASIYLLPEEILSEITLLSMLPLDSLSIWSSPVLAVCSRWRACAINTPRIWSCIMILPWKYSRERVECWLERSGSGCPLYLTVRETRVFKALEASWLNQTPDPGRRVRHLSFIQKGYMHDEDFPFPIRFDTSNLRSLDAQLLPRGIRESFTPTYKPFANNPPQHLQKLGLSTLGWALFVKLSSLDVSSLVSLVLTQDTKPDGVLTILTLTPRLRHFEWDVSSSLRSAPFKDNNPLILTSLHRLVLRGNHVVADVLGHLTTPNLRQLSIEGVWTNDMFRSHFAFAMTCPRVVHLNICDQAFNRRALFAKDVLDLLYALPRLEYLGIEWRDRNIEGLLGLCGEFPGSEEEDTSRWACPDIRKLTLPVSKYRSTGICSREQLARCLGRLVDKRCQTSELEGTGSRLSLTVDIDESTMVSLVGEQWRACGGESLRFLDFPPAEEDYDP